MRWDTQDLDAGPVPLWAQIADRLHSTVEAGAFCPGDKLTGAARSLPPQGARTEVTDALDVLRLVRP